MLESVSNVGGHCCVTEHKEWQLPDLCGDQEWVRKCACRCVMGKYPYDLTILIGKRSMM